MSCADLGSLLIASPLSFEGNVDRCLRPVSYTPTQRIAQRGNTNTDLLGSPRRIGALRTATRSFPCRQTLIRDVARASAGSAGLRVKGRNSAAALSPMLSGSPETHDWMLLKLKLTS
jgi:hypothetical protein